MTFCGDATAVRFDGEADVALFVPQTADVLRCLFVDWDALCKSTQAQVSTEAVASGIDPTDSPTTANLKLKVMLLGLGLRVE